jgi:mono/diheme cytochrome c family protein
MRKKKIKEGLELIVLVAFASLVISFSMSWGAGPAGPDKEESRADRGRQVYGIYCASCHGRAAEGDGPMAEVLKVQPPDLTRISQRNGGAFPEDRVASSIDGRLEMRSHGPSSMPVWGLSFRDAGRDSDQEREVQEKIKDLVTYLETIQK